MKRGKKYLESMKLVDRMKLYEPAEAMDIVQKTARAKFDETVEVHIKLGVDSRHADQQVRGAVVLPHGTGKTVRVLVFAKVKKQPRQKTPVRIMWARKNWLPKFRRKTGLILTLLLQLPI